MGNQNLLSRASLSFGKDTKLPSSFADKHLPIRTAHAWWVRIHSPYVFLLFLCTYIKRSVPTVTILIEIKRIRCNLSLTWSQILLNLLYFCYRNTIGETKYIQHRPLYPTKLSVGRYYSRKHIRSYAYWIKLLSYLYLTLKCRWHTNDIFSCLLRIPNNILTLKTS
jgi:hypothetical protein